MTMKKYGYGGPSDTKYVMNKFKKNGNVKKRKEISKEEFDKVSNKYAKQKGSKSLGDSKGPAQQVVSGRNSRNSVSRTDESRMTNPEPIRMEPAPRAPRRIEPAPRRIEQTMSKGAALTSAMNGYEMKRGGSCGKVYKKGSFRRQK